MGILWVIINWLVLEPYPSEKIWVHWDDELPNYEWKNNTCSKAPTRLICFVGEKRTKVRMGGERFLGTSSEMFRFKFGFKTIRAQRSSVRYFDVEMTRASSLLKWWWCDEAMCWRQLMAPSLFNKMLSQKYHPYHFTKHISAKTASNQQPIDGGFLK